MAQANTMKQAKKSFEAKSVEEEEKPSIFMRLFGETGTPSYSDSDDEDATLGTNNTDSTGTSDNDETDDGDRELARFDRDLRAKHRGACKNMTVSSWLPTMSNIPRDRFSYTFQSIQSGKYSKAIKAFEVILSDLLDRYGESHHRVGAALHNVAVANLRAGLLSDAKDAIEEAVRIRKATLGDQSSKLAVSLIVDASGRPFLENDF